MGKWIKENGSFDNRVSILQRILECIATNRNLTIPQLCKEIGKGEKHNIEMILDKYAYKVNDYINNNQQKDARNYSSNESKYPDLKYMLIIAKKEEEGVNQAVVYELSLFAIMLIVAIIRYNHLGVDNNRFDFNGNNNRLPLFFDSIPMEDRWIEISSNYPDKIPLIFGKWNLLKKELGSLFLYDNFDFMFYDKAYAVNRAHPYGKEAIKNFGQSSSAWRKFSSMLRILVWKEGIS